MAKGASRKDDESSSNSKKPRAALENLPDPISSDSDHEDNKPSAKTGLMGFTTAKADKSKEEEEQSLSLSRDLPPEPAEVSSSESSSSKSSKH